MRGSGHHAFAARQLVDCLAAFAGLRCIVVRFLSKAKGFEQGVGSSVGLVSINALVATNSTLESESTGIQWNFEPIRKQAENCLEL